MNRPRTSDVRLHVDRKINISLPGWKIDFVDFRKTKVKIFLIFSKKNNITRMKFLRSKIFFIFLMGKHYQDEF